MMLPYMRIERSLKRSSSLAIQLKLAELIRATEGTQNAMVNLEDLSDEQLERLSRLGGTAPISDMADIEPEEVDESGDSDSGFPKQPFATIRAKGYPSISSI